jgi:hydrogenase expression/formation protein HypC
MCLAIPGKVISVNDATDFTRHGKVDFGGVIRQVNLSLVPEAQIGDYVIVHVGLALSIMDEAEAQQVFNYLKEMDELQELEEADSEVHR